MATYDFDLTGSSGDDLFEGRLWSRLTDWFTGEYRYRAKIDVTIDGTKTTYQSSSVWTTGSVGREWTAAIDAGAGEDTVYIVTTCLVSYVDAGTGNDTVTLYNGTVYGGDGDDVITIYTKTSEYSTAYGGEGNDTISIQSGYADGGDGDDIIECDSLYFATLIGGAGDDTIIAVNVDVDGGTGDDYIKLEEYKTDFDETTVISGGDGRDTLDLSDFSESLTIDLNDGLTDIDGRTMDVDGTFENYVGTDKSEYISAHVDGSVIATGKGDDTLIGSENDDFLDAGDINTGDQDYIETGDGWDVVYLGDLGSTNEDYVQDPTNLAIWSDLDVNSDNGDLLVTIPWADYLNIETAQLALKLVPKVGSYLSAGLGYVDWLTENTDESSLSDASQASSTVVADFDARYDQVVMPVMSWGVLEPNFTDLQTGAQFALDAEDGGTFLTMYFADDFIDDFAAAIGIEGDISDEATEEVVTKSLWTNLWYARTSFERDASGTVSAWQGSEELTDGDATLESLLDNGEYMTLFGNVGGYFIQAQSDAPLVSGSVQGDQIELDSSVVSGGYGAYYIAAFEGNDIVIVDNAYQTVVYNGGDGSDMISFLEMQVDNILSTTALYADGISIDLSLSGQQVVGSGWVQLTDVEGVEGTAYDDTLSGDHTANILAGQGGDDVLSGGAGYDTLSGGTGDDTLTGGGDDDTFLFASGFDKDTVADFSTGDVLVFTGFSSSEVSTLMAALSQSGAVIDLGDDEVTVTGHDVSSFYHNSTENDDGTYDVTVGAYITRAEDPTVLSNEEAVKYLASYDDLIEAYGYNLSSAKSHFENYGRNEGRQITFDGAQYLENYSDLEAAYGKDTELAARHYVKYGYNENRSYADNITEGLASGAAKQSSVHTNGMIASNVLDGDADTFNHTGAGDTDPWLAIDLAADTWIDGIRILNRNDGSASHQAIVTERLDGATVEIYDDGVRVAQSTLSSKVSHNIDFGGVMGDEVRLYSNDGDYLHVAEVEVFGFANLTDMLDDSAATQSSQYNSSTAASNVLDGDGDTFNHTATGDSSPWVMVDLDADAVIELVQLENRQDNWTSSRLAGANVEILDDGEVVWTSADLGTADTQSIGVGGIIGDQVRINDAGGDWLHVAEIDIYGSYL